MHSDEDLEKMSPEELNNCFWNRYITEPSFREFVKKEMPHLFPNVAKEMQDKGFISEEAVKRQWGLSDEDLRQSKFMMDIINHLAKQWDDHQKHGTPLPPAFSMDPKELNLKADLAIKAGQGDKEALEKLKKRYPGEFDQFM